MVSAASIDLPLQFSAKQPLSSPHTIASLRSALARRVVVVRPLPLAAGKKADEIVMET
jgi:hypothetical protein